MVGKAWKSEEKESKSLKQPTHKRSTIIIVRTIGLIPTLKHESRWGNLRLIIFYSYS